MPMMHEYVEGGHRLVVQKRLKLPGTRSLEESAENMLVMSIVCAR